MSQTADATGQFPASIAPFRSNPAAFLVVMTATITPAEGVTLVRADPAVRKQDYLRALRFWLDQRDPRLGKILFLENSGAPLDDFEVLADGSGKPVEFISVPPTPIPAGLHYDYAEVKMLEYGLARSELWKDSSIMIKATGRLRFPGIAELLDRLPGDLEIAVDCRNRGRLFGGKRGFVPTQLFLVGKEFYHSHIETCYERMTPTDYLELLIYDELNALPKSRRRVLRWPVSVEPEGFAAHTSKQYNSPGRRAVVLVRKVLRTVAPWYWF